MKNSILELIPDYIRRLKGYVAGKATRQAQRESGVAMIKLASNENPLGPSPLAVEAIRAAAGQVNFYPDNETADLRAALAARHQLSPEQILVGDGSLGLLDVITRTLAGPGLNCITSERSFISYPIVTGAAGAELITTPMRQDAYDLEAIAAAINDKTRVVFFANPNNPTGTMFDADATDAFLSWVPDHVLVVLDEAYYDYAQSFARQRGITYTHSLDHVRAGRPNLLVLRTFSKAHGLAGLRLGYACGHPELLKYFSRVRNAFSVSAVAEAAGLAAIRDEGHIHKSVENNARGAAWLVERFAELGLRAVPTSGNFVYFEVDDDADAFTDRMQSQGVIVRSLVPWGIPNGIRVTVGTPEQNEMFFEALKKAIRQAVAR
jgi:histidinol-phosphate aminotransferase